ncbi:hypothetical protein [Burkholderia metallica]|uniref:hypothetical protein n=1 Tax=Burkholderia metallica TaxID=488729 RepID=UPI001CF5C205|nr:hypothetical protein [Burkholderia metallica]MCA8022720.1 hypothetical protein [Burkholderia metallica]
MKITSTSTQHAMYRDILGLTADEIGRIAIGTPVRVRLQASLSGAVRSLPRPQENASTTPCAARTALRIFD